MEGMSHRGDRSPLLLVIPPRPDESCGGMDHVVGAELAFAASSAGFPTLRFNFRGMGASQGSRSTADGLIEDALAALEVAVDNAGLATVFIASINGSDTVALTLFRREPQRVLGVCFISPSTNDLAQWPKGVRAVMGEHDNSLSRRAVTSNRERIEIIPGVDRSFQRGLTLVGKAVVTCLTEAATSRKH